MQTAVGVEVGQNRLQITLKLYLRSTLHHSACNNNRVVYPLSLTKSAGTEAETAVIWCISTIYSEPPQWSHAYKLQSVTSMDHWDGKSIDSDLTRAKHSGMQDQSYN